MKNVMIFAAGGIAAAVGFAAGYYFGSKKWKKKLRDEAEALERTYKALIKPPTTKATEETEDEGKGSNDISEEPAEEETVDDDPIDDPEEPGIDDEYEKVIKNYKGDQVIFNISEYEFEDDSNGYDKMEVVFFDEEEPHCIKSDTGEELIDWPVLLGFDEGCLCDEMFDSLQECYVRNTVSCIDFRVHRSSLEYID